MAHPQETNSNATSINIKKQHNTDKTKTTASVPALKSYRNKPISANSSRVKVEEPSN